MPLNGENHPLELLIAANQLLNPGTPANQLLNPGTESKVAVFL